MMLIGSFESMSTKKERVEGYVKAGDLGELPTKIIHCKSLDDRLS